MKKGLASRTALKFQRHQIERTQQNMSSLFTTFRTHTLSQSNAQILLPQNYRTGKNQDLIFLVTCSKISFYAELCDKTFSDKNTKQISILQNLVSIAGITLDNTGHFKGQMKCLDKQKVPKNYELEYAEILVKDIYLSRRDQYKVLKNLGDRRVHVYNRKTLYFDSLQLQFTNLMYRNEQVGKTGIITKNTKIIFRSGCAKYTILIQISKQIFQLNENKELYLEKAVHFLLLFFQRNNFFNNKHRIEIILFARLFYPQFKTLHRAYQSLQTNQPSARGDVFTLNYAVAFQKDCKGRIYQDAYRRILWSSTSIIGFKEKFWERVSQFMFTINWEGAKSYSKHIRESICENIEIQKIFQRQKNSFKIKPFLHRLPCQLSDSRDSCFFQAISIIAQQYKHHYYFRSLSETGNAITIVSAGKSFYSVDQTTYKMAKSNIYLTNISCIHVNLKRKEPKIKVQILRMSRKARYQRQDIKKLQYLLDWCIEQDAYKSPIIMNIQFADDFELKSRIFPENLKPCKESQKLISELYHFCTQKEHYINDESQEKEVEISKEVKQIEWITGYYLSQKFFFIHNFFYHGFNFEGELVKKKFAKVDESDFTNFERDLKIIINKKQTHEFSSMTNDSIISKKVTSYSNMQWELRQKQNRGQKETGNYQNKFANKLFLITSLEFENEKQCRLNRKTSYIALNEPFLEKSDQKRKVSDDIIFDFDFTPQNKSGQNSRTINIFEETYKRKQYIPKVNIVFRQSKKITHNKERLRKNYRQSNLHYMMTYFNQNSFEKLIEFFKKPEARTEQERQIYQYFQLQKQWKNLVFPILTPIYTNYRADLKQQEMNSKYSECGESAVEQQVCKYLMSNFQIQKQNLNSAITMSKGHVHLLLSITAKDNVTIFQAINVQKQKRITPKILYRYLCYEQKDYRFGAKSLMFSDENYYSKEEKELEKKSVKLVLHESQSKQGGSNMKDFIKLLKQKCKGLNFELSITKNAKELKCESFTININLVEGLRNKIYKSERIDVTFDKEYNPLSLYQIIIEWEYCCATYVQDFIKNIIISSANKNKIVTHMVSKTNAFNTRWTTATIGEIIFQSRLGMDMLEDNMIDTRNWLWDRQGYYMDKNGEAFIRFNKEKYLIEWFDNTIDKNKWKKLESEIKAYQKFFMKSAAYDFLGGMIDSFTNSNSRKSSLALST